MSLRNKQPGLYYIILLEILQLEEVTPARNLDFIHI